jgi:DNA-directed RNA polymerase specialized sigma subunit
MPRHRTKAEDIRYPENYFRKWLKCEKQNFYKLQSEIEENEVSLDEICETKHGEYAVVVNRYGEMFNGVLCKNKELAWIEYLEHEILYNAILQLTEEQKILLTYVFVNMFSQIEISKRLGVSQAAVSKRIKIIFKIIKDFSNKVIESAI